MSGRSAIDAVRNGLAWSTPILLPSAAALGSRIDAKSPAGLADPQTLVNAAITAARFLGADGVWISSRPVADITLPHEAHCDALMRAVSAAQRLNLAVVAEIDGPLHRARAQGEDLETALRIIKPGMIAEFDALAQLRPDIIVLREPVANTQEAQNKSLPRIYGAMKRLAEHFDILKGMLPALPGMSGAALPDLSFASSSDVTEGMRAFAIAPNWSDAETFATTIKDALCSAERAGLPLIVSGCVGLDPNDEPQLCRKAVEKITERA